MITQEYKNKIELIEIPSSLNIHEKYDIKELPKIVLLQKSTHNNEAAK